MKEQQKFGKHSDPFQYPKRKQPLRPPRERPKPAWQTDDIHIPAGKFTPSYQNRIPQRPYRGGRGRGGSVNRGGGMSRGQGRGFHGQNQMQQRTVQGFQGGRGRGQNMHSGGSNLHPGQGCNSKMFETQGPNSQTFGGPMRGQRFNRGRGQGSQGWVRGSVQQPMGGSGFDLNLAEVEQLQGALQELEALVQGPGSYDKSFSNRGHNSNMRGQRQSGRGRPFRRGRPY